MVMEICEKCGKEADCYFIFLKHICVDCNLDLDALLDETFEDWLKEDA